MKAISNLVRQYKNLPNDAWWLLGADVCLQLINSAFSILLNYVMIDHGYKDYDITSINGNRYLAVLLCSYPLALLSKRINIKMLMTIGAVSAPILSLMMLWCIHFNVSELLRITTFLWGVSFSLVQILALPVLMNICNESNETEAISLFFAAGSLTTILCGTLNAAIHYFNPLLTNISLLAMYCIIAAAGPLFIFKMKFHNYKHHHESEDLKTNADWKRIGQALLPTFLIAFGAGFTIPFINLFFKIVHGVESNTFSLMNSIAFTLVVIGGFLNPIVKRKFGYKTAIVTLQSFAIIALLILGTTEWFKDWQFAALFAMMMYIVRQPLMNLAGPLTAELSMKFVGEKNRKTVSAITSAIWSGSWFLSAMIFSVLREMNISYSNIIFITAAFYILGVLSYYRLILKFEKQDLIES